MAIPGDGNEGRGQMGPTSVDLIVAYILSAQFTFMSIFPDHTSDSAKIVITEVVA